MTFNHIEHTALEVARAVERDFIRRRLDPRREPRKPRLWGVIEDRIVVNVEFRNAGGGAPADFFAGRDPAAWAAQVLITIGARKTYVAYLDPEDVGAYLTGVADATRPEET